MESDREWPDSDYTPEDVAGLPGQAASDRLAVLHGAIEHLAQQWDQPEETMSGATIARELRALLPGLVREEP